MCCFECSCSHAFRKEYEAARMTKDCLDCIPGSQRVGCFCAARECKKDMALYFQRLVWQQRIRFWSYQVWFWVLPGGRSLYLCSHQKTLISKNKAKVSELGLPPSAANWQLSFSRQFWTITPMYSALSSRWTWSPRAALPATPPMPATIIRSRLIWTSISDLLPHSAYLTKHKTPTTPGSAHLAAVGCFLRDLAFAVQSTVHDLWRVFFHRIKKRLYHKKLTPYGVCQAHFFALQ